MEDIRRQRKNERSRPSGWFSCASESKGAASEAIALSQIRPKESLMKIVLEVKKIGVSLLQDGPLLAVASRAYTHRFPDNRAEELMY